MVTDEEVRAAKKTLDVCAKYAGRDLPVPDLVVRLMLASAERVRKTVSDGEEVTK